METRHISFPRWAAVLYGVLALILLPWICNLAINLPTHHIDSHWDAAWVGFDSLLAASLLVTALLALAKKVWVALSATMSATLFIVDAWFDIMTARPGREFHFAVFFGCIEWLLALMTLVVVYRVVKRSADTKQIKLSARARRKK